MFVLLFKSHLMYRPNVALPLVSSRNFPTYLVIVTMYWCIVISESRTPKYVVPDLSAITSGATVAFANNLGSVVLRTFGSLLISRQFGGSAM